MVKEPRLLMDEAQNDPDWLIRSHAIHALSINEEAEVKKILVKCLADLEWQVRLSALIALQNQVDKETLAKVLLLAEDSIPDIRIKAFNTIYKYLGPRLTQEPEYWQKVVESFDDDSIEVRLAVLDGLKSINDPAVSDLLFSKLINDSFAVRDKIVKILISQFEQLEPEVSGYEKLKQMVLLHHDDLDECWHRAIIEIMAIKISEDSVKVIETYLDHPSFTLREMALFQISKFNSPRVLSILLKNIKPDNHWQLRRTAVEGLVNHQNPEATSCLKGLRKDADPVIQAIADWILNMWELKNLPPTSGSKPKEDTK